MRVLFSHWQFFLIFQFNVNAKSTATLSIGIGENGKCVFVCFCSTHMNWKCERFQHCESDAGHYGNFIMAQHGRMKQMIEKKNTTPNIQLMDWIESTFQWDLYFVLLRFLWFFFGMKLFNRCAPISIVPFWVQPPLCGINHWWKKVAKCREKKYIKLKWIHITHQHHTLIKRTWALWLKMISGLFFFTLLKWIFYWIGLILNGPFKA